MKATETTQAAKDFIKMTRHESGVTYECLKCGHTEGANAYYEADHKAFLDHVAKCKANPQEPAQAQAQKPAVPPPPPAKQNSQHFTEAPASFNVKAISPAGFDIMLTLRDDNSTRLMKRVKGALKWLADNKFTPASARNSGGSSGNGPNANSGDGKQKYCIQKCDDPGFCPVHGKEMKKSQHHPGYYCPAKV